MAGTLSARAHPCYLGWALRGQSAYRLVGTPALLPLGSKRQRRLPRMTDTEYVCTLAAILAAVCIFIAAVAG